MDIGTGRESLRPITNLDRPLSVRFQARDLDGQVRHEHFAAPRLGVPDDVFLLDVELPEIGQHFVRGVEQERRLDTHRLAQASLGALETGFGPHQQQLPFGKPGNQAIQGNLVDVLAAAFFIVEDLLHLLTVEIDKFNRVSRDFSLFAGINHGIIGPDYRVGDVVHGLVIFGLRCIHPFFRLQPAVFVIARQLHQEGGVLLTRQARLSGAQARLQANQLGLFFKGDAQALANIQFGQRLLCPSAGHPLSAQADEARGRKRPGRPRSAPRRPGRHPAQWALSNAANWMSRRACPLPIGASAAIEPVG